MLEEKTISVVIPTFNDGYLLGKTLDGIPNYVDKIIVVNDGSDSDTEELLNKHKLSDQRIIVIEHKINMGLGQSLIDGYQKSIDLKCDISAVMAGDNQMSPADLKNILQPIVAGKYDYVKGNRLLRHDVVERMPKYRYVGNSILTLLTKVATGYWKLIDPQCGYTAISLKALKSIPIQKMIKGYGYNAHILNMLNLNNMKVLDIEVEPVYADEKSKIKVFRYALSVSKLLMKLTLHRLTSKYLVRDFHPLVLFYGYGFFQLILIAIPLAIRFIYKFYSTGFLPQTTLLVLFISVSTGVLSLLIGMWLDMDDNKRLQDYN